MTTARQMIEQAFPTDLPAPTPGEIRRERERTAHGARAAFLAEEARLTAELAAETRTWERQAAEVQAARAARQEVLAALRAAEAREARERVVVAWVVVLGVLGLWGWVVTR